MSESKNEIVPGTLASWPDPRGVGLAWTHRADEYTINPAVVVLDENNATIHPSQFPDILTTGTWVMADAYMKLYVVRSVFLAHNSLLHLKVGLLGF